MLRTLFLLCALVLTMSGGQSPVYAASEAHPALLDHDEVSEETPDGEAETTDSEGEDEEWDVNVPQTPDEPIVFNAEEGTWLSVDVSPDGETVAFDLLGDIYTIPIAGGAATRLTDGMAWDYQPRFSPDGSEILFTSDRSGGVNIWIMNADGSDLNELTDTGEKDTNSGAWSPDGQWIATKRRLTDTSSIGTTELWLHHRQGGDGIQVTKKDKLPEASSADFGPDGRFLYFSSRSRRFSYARNPHQGIYQISRFDRQTGQINQVTSRWGGAGRPKISPDGETLSYISRDGLETVLILHNLVTGEENVLFRGLDHDLMESFAWTGVYPSMDWMPDGESIVLWAGGKIHRVAIEDGSASEIPFSCDVSIPHQPAVRFEHDVTSETFTAKILRWVHATPDDGEIIFAALGRLYIAESDGSDPKVLLRKDDDTTLEYAPRISPDGKKLAYVSWNDVEKGHLWIAGNNGSGAKQLSKIPGQWSNPTWSQDGKEIVALKGSGATLRGSTLGNEMYQEIWVFDANGKGEPHFVTTVPSRGSAVRMPTPFFGPDESRIWFMRDAADNVVELVSVRRDGTDEKVHVKSKYGEEFSLSPNGNWVAFKRLHKAFVAPVASIGLGTMDLGDSDGSVKVYPLADDLVDWLRWEDDETITWSAANEFYRQTLDKVLAAAHAEVEAEEEDEEKDEDEGDEDGDDEESAEDAIDPNAAEMVTINLNVARMAPEGTLVIDGARLITMRGDEVIENGRIVVTGNRITALGAASEVELPDGAEIIDASGMTVMPGLIDAHAHMGYGSMDILPQRNSQYYANLAYGVTATMDPSASTHGVFAQAEMVEAGVMTGPRIYSTGFILYGADIAGRAQTNSYEDALRHVQRMKKQGAFAIKSYMQPKRIQRQWYVKACREEQMLNFPEGGGNFENNMGMILDGHTGIEHTTPVAPLYDDVQQMWASTSVGYTPTFLVAYGGLGAEHWFYQNDAPIWDDAKLTRFTPKAVVESRSRRLGKFAYDGDWHHFTVAQSANELLKKGVLVNLGAHGQRQGLGCHWDLWALSHGGADNHDVLRMGTINPATYLGLENQMGSLAEGMLADLIVLEGNPLEDIRDTNTVRWTVKNGEVFNANTMDKTWPESVERLPFMWE
ncbi:MAG: imidazolonepropionase-like amidohydrolase/Tol biopolymer transport system component [Candidatus Krumholzibacteriia bacterium]|jgi:imidazolonepropionase-like amidohydrolase/Tol biopolymer transport system component